MASVRTERGIAHERLSEQADQVLAIDGIHSATIRPERKRNNQSRSEPLSLCR
jgi:hypothetical protein